MPKKTYDVNKVVEVAAALRLAANTMLDLDISASVEAEDGWEAMMKVLQNHPEWDVIGGWISECIEHLKGKV